MSPNIVINVWKNFTASDEFYDKSSYYGGIIIDKPGSISY